MAKKEYIEIAQEIRNQARGIKSKVLMEKEIEEVMNIILTFFQRKIAGGGCEIKGNKIFYEVDSVYHKGELNILNYALSYYPKWVEKDVFFTVLEKVQEIFDSLEGYEAKSYFERGKYCLDITLTTLKEIK